MASFASKKFVHSAYASFRPSYPPELYATILAYHQGPKNFALDLGTGHGLFARNLAPHFKRMLASDPSEGMIKQAQILSESQPNIEYYNAGAEACDFVQDPEIDLVTAAQSSHWFNYEKVWPEMRRIVRPRGTLAFFGYKDHVLVSFPKATEALNHYCYGEEENLLGSYWQQPGRSIVQDKLRAVRPPKKDWQDVTRIEYEPSTKGVGKGEGTKFMSAKLTLGAMEEYIRTWSSLHGWQKNFPERKRRPPDATEDESSPGDVIDEMMDEMRRVEPGLRSNSGKSWKEIEVSIEWGSALLLARRKCSS